MSTPAAEHSRLSDNVQPTHYALTIFTDLEKLAFTGRVTISLDVVDETSIIVLNMTELSLEHASLSSNAISCSQSPSSQEVDTVLERVSLTFETALPAGSKAFLSLMFKGVLTGSSAGYYKSVWHTDDRTVNYALTQFEPVAARRAFPCWDEPSLKATFELIMVSRQDSVNLSNMPITSEELYSPQESDAYIATLCEEASSGPWKITRFETSLPMSTYLLAWANGPFANVESSYTSLLSGKTRPLRTYTTPDVIHQAYFVLEITAKVLPLYEKMFGIEYPLPKLDTLIVDDFDADAMENWGLIIGKKNAFLLDPNLADVVTKKRVATMQGHELAHMWFGNITTMAWWDNLYLNEGFATLMGEVFIVERILPEWKADSEFITVFLNDALALDAKPSSHPIEADCPSAGDIVQIFDALSYSKAAAVLRMLSNYVGEQAFLEGVSLYLKQRLYGNSISRNLWDAIGEVTGLEIASLMDGWVSKMGFPVVTVTERPDGVHIRQSRFWESGPTATDDPTLWSIPLCALYLAEEGQIQVDRTLLLDKREIILPISQRRLFKLNADTKGVFRVLYEPAQLLKMAKSVEEGEQSLTVNDRIGLIHDIVALGLAGYLQIGATLAVIYAFRHEKEYLIWNSISVGLSKLTSVFWENHAIIGLLNTFRRHLYGPLVERLGIAYPQNEAVDITLLRTNAIEQAASAGHEGTIQALLQRFNQWVETRDDAYIPADLMKAIYFTAVRYGEQSEYQSVKAIIAKPKTPTSGTAAMYALCATTNPDLIQETLRFVLSEAREQDVIYFFEGLQENLKTRRPLTEFFMVHYEEIYSRFKNNFCLKHLIECSFNALSSEQDYNATHNWFLNKDTSKYHLALRQSLDSIKARAACVQRSSADIHQWLEEWELNNTY